MYGYLADYESWSGLGQFTDGGNYRGVYISANDIAQYGTNGRGWSVGYSNEVYPAGVSKGGGRAFNIEPVYKNCHIWLRTE